MSQHSSPSSDDVSVRVSDAVARLYLDRFGKGPLHTSTFVTEEVITTVMRQVFTHAEKSMISDGNSDSVLITRVQWQSATNDLFRAAVAEVTGRTVTAAISGFDTENDLASEVFVLKPR